MKGQRGVQIPFRLLQPDHMILIQGWVNGVGPFEFILDTGASMVVITPAATKAAGIHAKGRKAKAYGTKGELNARIVRLKSVRLGCVETRTLAAAIVDLSALSRPMKIELGGVIGYNLLRRYRVTIDYVAKTVWLRRNR